MGMIIVDALMKSRRPPGTGQWVAVGSSGKLAYANDPTGTWTQVTSSFTTDVIWSVAYGNSNWVAVGGVGYALPRRIASTGDPTTGWTQRSIDWPAPSAVSDVAYGAGNWLAVNFDGRMYTTPDPTATWQWNHAYILNLPLKKVAYGNGYWVVGASTAVETKRLAYATDPTNGGVWTVISTPLDEATLTVRSLKYGNGYWAAGTNLVSGLGTNRFVTASDPTGTWTLRTLPLTTEPIQGIGYGAGYWVIAFQSGQIATATDPTGVWTLRGYPLGSYAETIDYGGGYWVIAGENGLLATATDPTGVWTLRTSSFGTTTIWRVAHGG